MREKRILYHCKIKTVKEYFFGGRNTVMEKMNKIYFQVRDFDIFWIYICRNIKYGSLKKEKCVCTN